MTTKVLITNEDIRNIILRSIDSWLCHAFDTKYVKKIINLDALIEQLTNDQQLFERIHSMVCESIEDTLNGPAIEDIVHQSQPYLNALDAVERADKERKLNEQTKQQLEFAKRLLTNKGYKIINPKKNND